MAQHAMNVRGPDGSAYNPARDLRQCYPEVVRLVAKRFEASSWPELNLLAARNGAHWDELCDAMESLVGFLSTPTNDPGATMEQALTRSGWFRQQDMAQTAVLAMLGTVVLGQLYYAIRETTPLGAPPEDMLSVMETLRAMLAVNGHYERTGTPVEATHDATVGPGSDEAAGELPAAGDVA